MTIPKRFKEWLELKEELDGRSEKAPWIKEGEVWWCSMGENVHIEINGKGEQFLRPVLILKKLGPKFFMGIPLTSQKKSGPWFVRFVFGRKISYAVLSQARALDAARLAYRMGTISQGDLRRVRAGFLALYRN